MHFSNILLFLLLPCLLSGQSPKTAALVIAVGNYAPGSNWPPTSAANDVSLVVNALVQQGFDREKISVLQDAAATKTGIENAIRTSLLAKAREGGTVVMHFSGHGQQVQDDNGDEADGLDEALVPYDSPKDFKAGQYQGENLLRDEQINQMLTPVRQKIGTSGRLLIVIDASYNGAGSRGQMAGRGADIPMAPPEWLEQLRQKAGSTAPDGFGLATSGVPAPGLAPVTVLLASTGAGAGAEFPGDDGRPVGALTYALTKALAEAAPGSTCAALMSDIRRILSARAPMQNPGLEGDASALVPGGSRGGPLRSFAASDFDKKTKQIRLSGGLLQGVMAGSEMMFFPADVRDTTGMKPVAKGSVVSADLLSATALLAGDISWEKIEDSHAFFRRRSFGGLKVGLAINVPDKILAGQVRALCLTMPFVHFEEKNADLQVLMPEPGLLELQTRSGISLCRDSAAIALAGLLADHVRQHAQAQYFREMALNEPSLEVSLDLIPVKIAKQGGKTVEQARFTLAGRTDPWGNIQFEQGDCFKISVTNRGNCPAHLTLLYIQPDDNITVLPGAADRQKRPGDFHLQPGENREYSYFFRIVPPEGICALKLIATETPLDLDEVMAGKGKLLRSENGRAWNTLEHFFAETFQNVTDLPSLPPGAAHVSTVIFRIGNE